MKSRQWTLSQSKTLSPACAFGGGYKVRKSDMSVTGIWNLLANWEQYSEYCPRHTTGTPPALSTAVHEGRVGRDLDARVPAARGDDATRAAQGRARYPRPPSAPY